MLMSDVKGGGPAFPVLDNPGDGALYCRSGGMTLRDYFAAAALPAVIEVCAADPLRNGETLEQMSDRAILAAQEAIGDLT